MLERQAEVEFRPGRDALGVPRVLGHAGDAVDDVLAFHLGEQLVVVPHLLLPGGLQRAVPEGQASRAEVGNQFLVVLHVAAADAEQLEDVLDLRLLRAFGCLEILRPQRLFLDGAAAPLEQAAHLALQAGAGNVRRAGQRVLDDGVVDTADVHFRIAGADAQAGDEGEGRGDGGDFGELRHGYFSSAL